MRPVWHGYVIAAIKIFMLLLYDNGIQKSIDHAQCLRVDGAFGIGIQGDVRIHEFYSVGITLNWMWSGDGNHIQHLIT